MTAAELIRAVEGAIGTLEAAYRGAATESDLYEASLLAVVIHAAGDAGGTVLLTNDGVNRAAELRFRRSPGNLWSGTFTYAVVSFPHTARRLEAHLGVYVGGASGVAHECDVALIDQIEADRSRAGSVHPRRRGLVASARQSTTSAHPGSTSAGVSSDCPPNLARASVLWASRRGVQRASPPSSPVDRASASTSSRLEAQPRLGCKRTLIKRSGIGSPDHDAPRTISPLQLPFRAANERAR